MLPNDYNAKLQPEQRPCRVLMISGSPSVQQDLNLNQAATRHPKKDEGEKLKDE